MKKNLFRVLACSLLSAFIFAGCANIEVTDSKYRTAPTVTLGSNTVLISFPKISENTQNITIYRFTEKNDTAPAASDKGVPIAMILPDAWGDAESYIYEDTYAVRGKNYYYRTRYYTSEDDYAYSKWSDKVKVASPIGIESAVSIKQNKITYDETDKDNQVLILADTISWDGTAPSGKWDYYLAVNCRESESSTEILDSSLIPLGVTTAGTEYMINRIFPQEYFGKYIEISGIVGVQKVEKASEAAAGDADADDEAEDQEAASEDEDSDANILYKIFTEPSQMDAASTTGFKCPEEETVTSIDYR